jgi:acyl-CoA-dependent ceramide synthase
VVVWGYLRHYINIKILYSIVTTFETIGPFELNWETQQYKCWISQYISFALLASLQAVNLFWFFLILRIAFRFIWYKTADDDRSEYEPTDEETEEREKDLKMLGSEAKATGIETSGITAQKLTT